MYDPRETRHVVQHQSRTAERRRRHRGRRRVSDRPGRHRGGARGEPRRPAAATRWSTRARRGRTSAGRRRASARSRAACERRHGLMSVVLWGPGEEALAQEVVPKPGGAALLSPQTSIADLVALARGAALMVSGDTGPTHIAAAVGTPIVGIYGPTRPARNGRGRRTTSPSRATPSASATISGAAGASGCACSTSRSRKCSPRSSGACLRRRSASGRGRPDDLRS